MKIDTNTHIHSHGKGNTVSGIVFSTRKAAPASHDIHRIPSTNSLLFRSHSRNRQYAMLLWLLTVLFAARVLGQAIQRWIPQPYLPPFHAFQGSGLPYWLLLTAQVLILAAMIHVSRAVQKGALTLSRRATAMLGWLGSLYMTASLGRIAIGLVLPGAPAWFSTWIPAFFHIVLAGFVLSLHHFARTQYYGASQSQEVWQ